MFMSKLFPVIALFQENQTFQKSFAASDTEMMITINPSVKFFKTTTLSSNSTFLT